MSGGGDLHGISPSLVNLGYLSLKNVIRIHPIFLPSLAHHQSLILCQNSEVPKTEQFVDHDFLESK